MSELTIAKYNHYIFHAILATVASIGYEPLRISHISSFFFFFFLSCFVFFFPNTLFPAFTPLSHDQGSIDTAELRPNQNCGALQPFQAN